MITHKSGYSLLALLSGTYLAIIFRYQSTPRYLLFATVIFAILYLLWGILHQFLTKNFHVKIMLEYLLVALLGVAIVSTLLL